MLKQQFFQCHRNSTRKNRWKVGELKNNVAQCSRVLSEKMNSWRADYGTVSHRLILQVSYVGEHILKDTKQGSQVVALNRSCLTSLAFEYLPPNPSQVYRPSASHREVKRQFYCFSSLTDQAMYCLYFTDFTFKPLFLK